MAVLTAPADDTSDQSAPEPPPDTDNRRRHHRACAVGGAVAFLLFFWLLTAGTWNPLRYDAAVNAGFSDAQVEAWFDGRWDVPTEEAGIEAFVIDGETFVYFGPVPALMRVPFLAASGWFDHRLAGVSLSAAYVVALTGATALSWRIRTLLRGPGVAVGRRDQVAVFGFMLLLGAGSNVLFLSSRAWAYQEAMLWGVAFAFWSFAYLLDHLRAPSTRALGLAAVFATLSFSSRGTVGSAPVVALAVLAGVAVCQAVATRTTRADRLLNLPGRWLRAPELPLGRSLLGVLLPVGTYAAVNFVKFGSLFRLPVDSQIYINYSRPARVAALEANGGSLFGLKFAPTNLVHYLRPDGFDLDRVFPFFLAPKDPPWIIGGAVFDGIEPAASISVTMPIFLVLAAVGVIVILRGRADPGTLGPAPLRVLLIGGSLAALSGLSIAWNTQRYQGDLMPLLILGALAGLHVLLARPRRPAGTPAGRAARRVGAAALALVVLGSIYANFAVGIYYQRVVMTDAIDRVGFVAFQQDLDARLFPDRPPAHVRQGTELPLDAQLGDLFIVGECEGLYVTLITFQVDDEPWMIWTSVERTAATGGFRLSLDFPEDRPADPEPLLVSGPPGDGVVLAVEYLEDEFRFALGVESLDEWWRSDPLPIEPEGGQVFDVVFDRRTLTVTVQSGDETVFTNYFWKPHPDPDISIGTDGFAPLTAPSFTGEIESEPLETPTCDLLLERLDQG